MLASLKWLLCCWFFPVNSSLQVHPGKVFWRWPNQNSVVFERDAFIFSFRSVTVAVLTSDQNIEVAPYASLCQSLRVSSSSLLKEGELHVPHELGWEPVCRISGHADRNSLRFCFCCWTLRNSHHRSYVFMPILDVSSPCWVSLCCELGRW